MTFNFCIDYSVKSTLIINITYVEMNSTCCLWNTCRHMFHKHCCLISCYVVLPYLTQRSNRTRIRWSTSCIFNAQWLSDI